MRGTKEFSDVECELHAKYGGLEYISKEVKVSVQACPTCQKTTISVKEPLLTTPLPLYPWERVAADLFGPNGSIYLLVVDYYSQFIDIRS